jgi:hypothetical protein
MSQLAEDALVTLLVQWIAANRPTDIPASVPVLGAVRDELRTRPCIERQKARPLRIQIWETTEGQTSSHPDLGNDRRPDLFASRLHFTFNTHRGITLHRTRYSSRDNPNSRVQ